MSYMNPATTIRDAAKMVRPPVRMSVSDATEEYVNMPMAGGAYGAWDKTLAPTVVEPMNMLTSRKYNSVVFAGPARTGKTLALVLGGVSHAIKCAPTDVLIVQMSESKARRFSKKSLARMINNSPDLLSELSKSAHGDNVFDKWFKSGMSVNIGWPSVTQAAGDDFRLVMLTDYDRMPQDVGGEGSPYVVFSKRTQTFLSRGMTLVESSPGFDITDPSWIVSPERPHEAPPTLGILSLFNMGDRRRWYWKCPHCNEFYMQSPGAEGFSFRHKRDASGITITDPGEVRVICTANGCLIEERHKVKMNAGGVWVPEGQVIDEYDGEINLKGDIIDTDIASYWQPGATASFQGWKSIISNYLNNFRQYELTGDESGLKAKVNVDMGAPYLRQRFTGGVKKSRLSDRRDKSLKRYEVPDGVRGLTAHVDVQGGKYARWDVMVVGIGVNNEKWIIDRYSISESKRVIDGDVARVNPATHIEDWDLLTDRVINGTYKLSCGLEMRIHKTTVDMGGEAGVSEHAYTWWRGLRRNGCHARVFLNKGDPSLKSKKTKISYPDSTKRSNRFAGSRGDIPVLMINTNVVKDAVYNDLLREDRGPGYINFPSWLGDWFFKELESEVRGDDGKWEKITARNESFDLLVYCYALLMHLNVDSRINWDNPPGWLRCRDENTEVMTADERRSMKENTTTASARPRKSRGRSRVIIS